jgi:hypothetical protein
MNCINCKKDIPETAKVCGYCGTKIEQKIKNTCPECGKEVPPTAKVCGFCGMKLAAAPVKAEKPAPEKKVQKPKVREKEAKSAKEVKVPKAKREPIKFNLPKWVFAVIAVAVIAVLVLVLILPKLGGGSGEALPFSGKWVGDVHGVGNDFTATMELDIDKRCSIGDICGSYRDINGAFNGDLELVSVSHGVYKFLEHPKEKDILESSGGHQSIQLIGSALHWSFNKGIYSSAGTFFRK